MCDTLIHTLTEFMNMRILYSLVVQNFKTNKKKRKNLEHELTNSFPVSSKEKYN